MKKIFMIITGIMMLFSPAALMAEEDIQFQLVMNLCTGVNFTDALNNIPSYYGERAAEELNNASGGYSFSSTDTSNYYMYGWNIEPRLFITILGAGVDVELLYTPEATSEVSSYEYYDEITYSASLYYFCYAFMLYLRPYYTETDYFILGLGVSSYTSLIDTTSDYSLYDYTIDTETEVYEASGTGYRFLVEYGMTMGATLFNLGCVLEVGTSEVYESGDGYALIDPSTGSEVSSSVINFYTYVGFGIKI